jgi:hypothetical protein
MKRTLVVTDFTAAVPAAMPSAAGALLAQRLLERMIVDGREQV